MKKKTLALLLCAASLLALAACGRAKADTAEATPEPTEEPVVEALAAEPDITPEPEPTEEPEASEEPMLNELDLRAYVELFDLFAAVQDDIDEDAVSAKDESIAGTPLVDNNRVVRSVTVDLSGVDYTKTGEYDAVYTIVIDRDAYDIAEAERMAEASGEPAEAINENDDAELVEDELAAEETADDVTDETDADADAEPEALPEEFNAEEAIVIKHVTILTEDEFNELAEQEGYTLNENGLLVKANPTDEDMAAEALAELGVDVNDENVTLETSVNDEGKLVVTATVTDEDGNKTTTEAVVDNRTGNVNVTDNTGNTSTIPVATPTPVPATKPTEPTTPATPVTPATPAPTAAPTPQPTEKPKPEESKSDTGSNTGSNSGNTSINYVQGVNGMLPDSDGDGIPDGYSEPGWARSEENPANQRPANTTPPTPYAGRNDHDDRDRENGPSTTDTGSTTAQEPVHTHDWQPVYATREVTTYTTEQQITGYTDGDPIYGTQDVPVGAWHICNWCGERFSTGNGISDHCEETGHNGWADEVRYETQTVITGYEQVPVYSEVQVPHTSTEQYIDHYECSCGQTKAA